MRFLPSTFDMLPDLVDEDPDDGEEDVDHQQREGEEYFEFKQFSK